MLAILYFSCCAVGFSRIWDDDFLGEQGRQQTQARRWGLIANRQVPDACFPI
jgi:hypothetical protein